MKTVYKIEFAEKDLSKPLSLKFMKMLKMMLKVQYHINSHNDLFQNENKFPFDIH